MNVVGKLLLAVSSDFTLKNNRCYSFSSIANYGSVPYSTRPYPVVHMAALTAPKLSSAAGAVPKFTGSMAEVT